MKFITLNYRKLAQWALFLFILQAWIRTIFVDDFFFNFEACCPMGGLQSVITLFTNGALTCSMTGTQVALGVTLCIVTIIFSKLFCSYICPLGTITEGLQSISRKLKLPVLDLHGIPDVLFRSLKYILLGITLYYTMGSNDLFCKTYDPFYATVTLFGEDVKGLYAIISIALLIIGSLFLRQFWCRYLCPLGAISNAFKYFYVFIAYAAVITLLTLLGLNIEIRWVFVIAVAIAYIVELIALRKNIGPQIIRIQRTDSCIDCGLCSKKCPQAIDVANLKVVNHPDCNMCTDCIGACPAKGAIGVNGDEKKRWLPLIISLIFVIAGLIAGSYFAIPTVDMRWGSEEELERSSTVELGPIKNVKCFGSSMGFAQRMKGVKGVTGVETYIKNHDVIIHYDTTMLSADDVRRAVFIPTFLEIHEPENDADVHIYDVTIDNFFDELDRVFIANMSREIDEIYSIKSIYGEKIKVRFFVDSTMTADTLTHMIENLNLIYRTPELSFTSKDLYKVDHIRKSDTIMSGIYLRSMSFPTFKRTFNNRKQYSNEQLGSVVIPISKYPRNQQMMQYVANHLGSANKNIVGLITRFTSSGPQAIVFYVKENISEDLIKDIISDKNLKITYQNGKEETFRNPYVFNVGK